MSDASEEDLRGVQQDIDDLDLLDYSSQSQTMSECGDIDDLLQPLSNSQQMREDELDRQDELIRQQIIEEEERRKAEEDHQIIVSKHRRKPTVISTRPPGLKVFLPEHSPAFTFSDLGLQKHFGWQGREEEPGDLLGFLRSLTQEVSHNHKMASSQDFHSLANFIFSKAVLCRDRQLFQVLRKVLSDLLRSYPTPWVLSLDMFLTHLLNLGADPLLLNNPHFYQANQDFCQQPTVVPELSEQSPSQSRTLEVTERQIYLSQLLQITSDVMVLPGRQAEYEALDPKVWHSFIFITAVVAQEETIINQLEISQNISSLLSNLLIQLSEESFQDIAQLLTAALRPAEMSESSSSGWGSGQLPEHFRAVGLNHPHNMLYLTSLLPGHFSRLQQLVSFMFIQLIINSQDCDLPDECHVMDVIDLLENNGGQLKKSWAKLDADEELYSCWCLLQLLDILVLKVGKE